MIKWKTIPGRGSHDRESSILPNGGTGEKEPEKTLVRWTKRSRTW